jgi:hypothetical protein
MKTKIELENGNKISAFVELHQLRQDRGGSTWRCRYSIKDKRVKFSANRHDDKNEALITINRKIHDVVNEEKIKSNRSTAPTLTQIVTSYFEATPSSLSACQNTRKLNVSALRLVTRGVVAGSDPVIEKQKDGSFKLVSGGFWDNFRLDKLVKKVGKAFLDSRVKGYKEKTDEWYNRAHGANDVLRQAKAVFSKAALSEVYIEQFKMPDLEDKETGFLKVRRLPERRKDWVALSQSVRDQIITKVPTIEKEDVDVYACFLLQYGAGLSWGEVMHSQYSWLGVADRPYEDGSTRYTIKIQPVGDWVPKCARREREISVPENIFQKLIDIRYARRAPREDRKSTINVSDEELARLVWSEPAVAVGKRFDVSSTTVKKHCEKRGIPTPGNGFWTNIRLGKVPHPQGEMPDEERTKFLLRTHKLETPKDDFILQRHRCNAYTGANRRLARWFRENIDGWDRKQVGHELRKLNISNVVCSTGSVLEGSKHAGHSSIKVTERHYLDIVKNKKVDLPFPNT